MQTQSKADHWRGMFERCSQATGTRLLALEDVYAWGAENGWIDQDEETIAEAMRFWSLSKLRTSLAEKQVRDANTGNTVRRYGNFRGDDGRSYWFRIGWDEPNFPHDLVAKYAAEEKQRLEEHDNSVRGFFDAWNERRIADGLEVIPF